MESKLPKDWKWVKLSEIGKIISGGTPSTSISEYWEGNINWIAPSDLTGYKNIRIKSGKKSITELGLKKSSARLMPKGSVLFSCRAPIGYTVIADDELCTNQGFKSIIPYDFVNSLYIYYFLKASKQEAEKVASGTTFKEISLKSFSELSFPLPPIESQQATISKIEELFSELDKGIEDLKTAQLQLKTYRQSVLKWAFEGKLTNENVKDGELPKGWKIVDLKEVCEVKRGKSKHRPRNAPELYGGNYPFIQTGNIRNANGGYIKKYSQTYSEMGLAQSKLWPKGTLCITIAANIGETAILDFEACFPDSVVGLLSKKDTLFNKYLNYFFISFKQKLEELAPATAQKNINVDILEKINIPLAPLEEQHLIVQEIESRLSVADKMEESIAQSLLQAEALRQSILKKAFSGELV